MQILNMGRHRAAALAASALAVAVVAGCAVGPGQSVTPIGASTAPVGGRCDAQGAQQAVGQRPTAKVLEQARVGAGARMARVLRPGQAVTQEFDAERLNLVLDGSGVVRAVRCG